tara:strand:+ start:85 stop:246 length:162 start_codon:yes stop_codon:yes gene_type:complete
MVVEIGGLRAGVLSSRRYLFFKEECGQILGITLVQNKKGYEYKSLPRREKSIP